MDGRIEGLQVLIERDADIARAFQLAGQPAPRKRPPGFASLLRIIVNQQVSQHAGQAIWRRLEDGLGDVSPKSVLGRPERRLRALGLSRAKARYARALAGMVVSCELDLNGLKRLDDDAARAELTRVPGIGRWTADIYLMFALGRPDVWPAGDLALAVAAERLLGRKRRPSPKEMETIGHAWRPWRTAAALMLWHFYRCPEGGRESGD
ncbi:MAG: DNA-3-methyladenine glycosylase 2 family protein [Rhodospirillales bacterium]|nr:DNA-3-methyladenine glycosylase 2 family protein [Rhodospirillales bacterium]